MSAENIPSTRAPIAEHPDIVGLSARYELLAETPAAQAVDGATTLAGLFVAASPWIVGFNGVSTLAVNNLIVGIAIAILGIGFAAAFERTHRLSWVCPVLGAWTIAAVWVVNGSVATTSTILSNVVSGGVVVLLGLGAFMALMRRGTRRS